MRKIEKLIIVTLCLGLFLSCGLSLHDKKAVSNSSRSSLQGEGFSAFVERFHTDSLFRISRYCDVITGGNTDDSVYYSIMVSDSVVDYTYIWDKKEANDYVADFISMIDDPEYVHSYKMIGDSVVEESCNIPESSCLFWLCYKKDGVDKKWRLSEIHMEYW